MTTRPRRRSASRCRTGIDTIAAQTAGRGAAILVAALGCAMLPGCAVRYDGAGVTRAGIGLWGFGDPPGVNWNLDWPRREFPDLPRTPLPELPPPAPASAREWRSEAPYVEPRIRVAGQSTAIDDNPTCALRRDSSLPSRLVAVRADAGGGRPASR